MRIGILGSGLMGGKLGTIFARAGHQVVFSYAHSPRKLQRLDAGELSIARYLEPFTMAMAQLAYEGDGGPEIAYRIERFGKKRRQKS